MSKLISFNGFRNDEIDELVARMLNARHKVQMAKTISIYFFQMEDKRWFEEMLKLIIESAT